MRQILLPIFLFISLGAIPQTVITDTTIIRGITRDFTYFYDKPDFLEGQGETTIKKGELMYVVRIIKSVNPDPFPYWYYCIYHGDEGYVPTIRVDIYGNFSDEKYRYLNSTNHFEERLSISRKLGLKDKQKFDSITIAEQNKSDALNKEFHEEQEMVVKKLSELVTRDKFLIVSYSYPYSTTLNYPGFKVRFINGMNKEIKYVWFKIDAYNAVNDIEQDKELRCIGPVESFGNRQYEFENVFISNVIDHCEIKAVKIQYSDNKIITLSGASLSLTSLKLSLSNWQDLESTLKELRLSYLEKELNK